MEKPKLSIIVPLYNEAENIPLLQAEMALLYGQSPSMEVIYVDDGSIDDSLAALKRIASSDERVKVLSFARNYGQTAAMGAGAAVAKGETIVFLDADLQNDPNDIPALLKKMDEGYDVVSGWRKDRHDSRARVFLSHLANGLIARVTGVHLNDYGCTLKAYRAHILKNIDFVGEVHRLLPAYASWQGAKVAEIVVNHRPRTHGVSKYGFSRIGKVLLDLIVVKYFISYAQKPIYFFGFIGIGSMCLGFFSLVLAIFLRFAYHISLIQTPLVLLSALLVMVGVQLITMGIIAEMIMRTRANKEKSPYAIKEKIGLN